MNSRLTHHTIRLLMKYLTLFLPRSTCLWVGGAVERGSLALERLVLDQLLENEVIGAFRFVDTRGVKTTVQLWHLGATTIARQPRFNGRGIK